ncbi:hypothetical protein [Pedobacter roseus]|uniref:Uncharacterized protein n=1 Tax=Pedobacter roseus TaxID=336820 RepID=A0A7G9QL01_9SPHI|nr:hypothetical protein [Pedobacter roseus]QNN44026.1 hypothetical protein H9L23_08105 [Pedobacter roseus]
MNAYNENLRSATVNTLQGLDLEEKRLKSQVNAAMFNLYYAEGATITAEQNLVAATNIYKTKVITQREAEKDSNVLVNLVGAATQANQYVNESTSSVAVSATNVKVATNAIVRLAGDVDSIYNILHAEDFVSNIYTLAKEARELLNETACDAEVSAQLAMEASILTAEVSASAVLDMAKTTSDLMNSILEITTADFNAANQALITHNNAMVAVQSTEKLNEGALQMVSTSYSATKSAYALADAKLNLNLNVKTSETDPLSFSVNFDLIQSPFPGEKPNDHPMYPVEKYYIMVVKEQNKQTFSITNAENILLSGKSNFIAVMPPKASTAQQEIKVYNYAADKNAALVTDSDQEPIEPGKNYVVFVMGVFTDDYKRKINFYDDYLSAPSQVFILIAKLQQVAGKSIKLTHYKEKDLSDEERSLAENIKKEYLKSINGLIDDPFLFEFEHVMSFESNEPAAVEVEYRCLFLPVSANASDRLPNIEPPHFLIENEIGSLEAIPSLSRLDKAKPGFLFNVPIAEQVSTGNYTVAHKKKDAAANGATQWIAFINPDSTDNFGNKLIKGEQYLPVVLSYSTVAKENDMCFLNALSEMSETDYFHY